MIEIIYNKISQETGIPVNLMKKKTRKREVVQARQIVQYFLSRYTKYSLQEIGNLTGNFDHATVLSSKKTISNLIDTNKHFREWMQKIDKFLHRKYKNLNKEKNKKNAISDQVKEIKKDLGIHKKVILNDLLQKASCL